MKLSNENDQTLFVEFNTNYTARIEQLNKLNIEWNEKRKIIEAFEASSIQLREVLHTFIINQKNSEIKQLSIDILKKVNEIFENPEPKKLDELKKITEKIPSHWENGAYARQIGAAALLFIAIVALVATAIICPPAVLPVVLGFLAIATSSCILMAQGKNIENRHDILKESTIYATSVLEEEAKLSSHSLFSKNISNNPETKINEDHEPDAKNSIKNIKK